MAQGALSIKLRCASWQQLATIYQRDLSRGAMFLRASSLPPVGTAVRIDLTLPSASVIVLHGVVEHHVSDPQRGTGVELKLAPIPTGSLWLIESALAAHQRRQPTPPAGVPATTLPDATHLGASTVGDGNLDGEQLAEAEAELIRALLAEAEALKKLNPFLVLGVGYEASDADVRAAFGALTKRYHPDRFARYESPELRQVAAEIFILIRDAYRRLADPQARAQAVASIGSAAPPRAVPASRPVTPALGVPVTAKLVQPIPIPIPSAAPRAVADPRSGPIPARPPAAPPAPPGATDSAEGAAAEELIEAGRLDEALAAYKVLAKKHPQDRRYRAGLELGEGLLALAQRDRLEAAQRFEAALELDPSNERAARELAEMRRQATNERKGLLSRLMGKKEP